VGSTQERFTFPRYAERQAVLGLTLTLVSGVFSVISSAAFSFSASSSTSSTSTSLTTFAVEDGAAMVTVALAALAAFSAATFFANFANSSCTNKSRS
jgi:hypothetical protein